MTQVIVVTGVTSGFGQATARLFAKNGWLVIGTGRRADRLFDLARELGARFLSLHMDMRDREAVFTAFAGLDGPWASPDVLVNNAGLALGMDTVQEGSVDDWEVLVDTNIKGILYATKAILPGMVKRNRGHVINIGSITGHYPYAGASIYSGTKAFVTSFSAGLRADLLGTGVRVSNIEPGLAKSEFSLTRFHGDKDRADNVYSGVCPLTPDDVAESVRWVVSLPEHVNVNRLELMPVCQAPAAPAVYRC